MRLLQRSIVVVAISLAFVAYSEEDSQRAEQSDHSVVITSFDPELKIRAIKAIRAETDLGLADAKRLIEDTPSIIKTGLTRREADALAARLRAHGMTVEARADS